MEEPSFELDDFKNWMKKEDRQEISRFKSPLIGTEIESKVSSKKLMEILIPEVGESPELSFDFKKNGGIILDVDDRYFLVQVECGNFHIARRYVRKK